MKSIQLILLAFFIGIFCSNAQTEMFDQEYYFIAKGEIKQLKQVQDSMYIFECSDLKNCNKTPYFSYKILRDSIIDENSKMFTLKGKKYKRKKSEAKEKNVALIKLENGKLKLEEIFNYPNKRRVQKI